MIDLSRYSVKELEAELYRRKQEELQKASDYEIEKELSKQKHRNYIQEQIKNNDNLFNYKISECITNLDLSIDDIIDIDVKILKMNPINFNSIIERLEPVKSIRITVYLNNGTTRERVVNI